MSGELRVAETAHPPAAIENPESQIRNRVVAWVAAHEGIGVLALAPLLLFPAPATVALAGLGLVGLRLAVWRATGQVIPAGAPGLPALWLLGMAAVGQAISLDAAVSLPRLVGLLLGLAGFYAAAGYARRYAGSPRDLLPWALPASGLGLALLMPLVVDWAEKAP